MSRLPSQSASHRLDSIDALRGLAALAVALYHIWGKDGTYPWPSIGVVTTTLDAPFYAYLLSPFRWGYLGVSLFLVLSGFCIHLAYARSKVETGSYNFEPRTFFLRRIWRLYPAYVVAVVGTALLLNMALLLPGLDVASRLEIPSLTDVWVHLVMLHGVHDPSFYSIVSVFWSLALEFQLYLAYPLFLIAFRRLGTGKTLLLLTAVSIVFRAVAMHVYGYGLISISATGPFVAMGSIFARMPEWLIGAWIAELYSRGLLERLQARWIWPAVVVAATLAVASTLVQPLFVATDPLFGLTFGLVVIGAITARRAFRARVLVQLGVVSYTFYLFHLQLFWLIAPIVDGFSDPVFKFALRVAWMLATLWVVRKLFVVLEKPFLSLPKATDRLYPLRRILEQIFGIKTDSTPSVALPKSSN
jgi:peptidoglycan/LPS O-acetylase OafA/YrhL